MPVPPADRKSSIIAAAARSSTLSPKVMVPNTIGASGRSTPDKVSESMCSFRVRWGEQVAAAASLSRGASGDEGARASGGDDDVGVGGGRGVAGRSGWGWDGDQEVDEVKGA